MNVQFNSICTYTYMCLDYKLTIVELYSYFMARKEVDWILPFLLYSNFISIHTKKFFRSNDYFVPLTGDVYDVAYSSSP